VRDLKSRMSESAILIALEPDEYLSSSSHESWSSARSSRMLQLQVPASRNLTATERTSMSGSHVPQPTASLQNNVEPAKLPTPKLPTAKSGSAVVISVPYKRELEPTITKKAKPTVPTCRYEDYEPNPKLPSTTLPRKRATSLSSMFRRRRPTSS
jgi:hypothetical protein